MRQDKFVHLDLNHLYSSIYNNFVSYYINIMILLFLFQWRISDVSYYIPYLF